MQGIDDEVVELHVERLVEAELVGQADAIGGGGELAQHQLHRIADVLEQREGDERHHQHDDDRLQQAAKNERRHRRGRG